MPDADPPPTRLVRLGPPIAWAGALGLGLIALLAAGHLVADLLEVGRALVHGHASLVSVGLTLVVIAAALVAVLLAARLSGEERSGQRAAVLIGLGLLILVRVAVAGAYEGVGDGELRQYDELARGVLAGDCCFADRPMGYPMVLAFGYRVFGAGHLAVDLLNIACAIASGVLVLALARRLYGSRVGAVALVLYALWPAGALMIVTSLPQTSYELMVVAAAYAALATAPGWRGSALVGLLLGASQYLRPTTPVLLPVYLLARVWPGSSGRRFLGSTLAPMLGVFLVVLVPVIAHNQSAHGELSISTSSYGGHGLWIGINERTGGRYSAERAAEVMALPGRDLWEKSEQAGQQAMERIRANPLRILVLGLRKQDTLWGTERYGVQYAVRRTIADDPGHPASTLPSITSGAFWVLVTGGTAAGLWLRRRRPDALMILVVGLVAAVSLMHALLEVRDRYHSYVVPLLLPLAALAIVAGFERSGLLRRPAGVTPRPSPEVG